MSLDNACLVNNVSANPDKHVDVCSSNVRAICFYLPQFHPITENNAWWGKGFTDWSNVVKGRPRVPGQYQPHLPADLGFYDLRLEETRISQANLARAHGISGFCYYHYWFQGKRLLEQPVNEMLASGKPDFPFCLCWANQTWSRTWSGRGNDVLIEQTYDAADHDAHIDWLATVFNDPRYICIDKRPLFLVYLAEGIPDVTTVLARWRHLSGEKIGVEPWICAVKTGFSTLDSAGIRALGFDGVVEFEPNRMHFPVEKNATGHAVTIMHKLLPSRLYDILRNNRWLQRKTFNTVIDYSAYVSRAMAQPELDSMTFPCVFPSWDNTARRTAATIIENHDPELYRKWLENAIFRVAGRSPDTQLVFINAWNEWAEGCHLEPDEQHGMAFLQATRAMLDAATSIRKGDR